MNKAGLRWTDTVLPTEDAGDVERLRLAQGWRQSIQLHERIRRQDAGLPLLEITKD